MKLFFSLLFILATLPVVATPTPLTPPNWEKVPGAAAQIAAGGNRLAMIDPKNNLFQWNYDQNRWMSMGGTARSVAVDHNGHIWIVKLDGKIERFANGKWATIDGAAGAVYAGGTKVFVSGKDNAMLYEWSFSANRWVKAGRVVQDVAIDAQNGIWTLENNRDFYRYASGKWSKMPGYGKGLSAGGNEVLAIGDNRSLYRWNGSGWVHAPRPVKDVAVDHRGHIWAVDANDGSIHRTSSL